MGGIAKSPDTFDGVGMDAKILPVVRDRNRALKSLFIRGSKGAQVIEYHNGYIALDPDEAFQVPEGSPRLNLPRLQLPKGGSLRWSKDVDSQK